MSCHRPDSTHTITSVSIKKLIRGKCTRTGRVSCYLADLVPMTEVCPVTYTEILSNVWTTADYSFRCLISHVRHEGVPPFSQGEWRTVLYARKRTYRMSCVFLAAACGRIEARITGYNFFRFHGVASPKTELWMTFYERSCPGYSRSVRLDGLALRSRHDYDNNVHNSTIYS